MWTLYNQLASNEAWVDLDLCLKGNSLDVLASKEASRSVSTLFSLEFIHVSSFILCTDPESFVRGGPTYSSFCFF